MGRLLVRKTNGWHRSNNPAESRATWPIIYSWLYYQCANTTAGCEHQKQRTQNQQIRVRIIVHLHCNVGPLLFAFYIYPATLHRCSPLSCMCASSVCRLTRILWQCPYWSRRIDGHKFNESLCVVLPSVHFFVPFTLSDRAIIRTFLLYTSWWTAIFWQSGPRRSVDG